MATSTNGKAKSNGKAVAKNRVAGKTAAAKTAPKEVREQVTISAPNIKRVAIRIRGTSVFCQNKFSNKALEMMKQKQEAGSRAAKGTKREAKDFNACYEAAMYRGPNGEYGIPCVAFRKAMVRACSYVGFQMTKARGTLFVESNLMDQTSKTDLVQITKGEPQYSEDYVRNATGVCDIRPRPKWMPGWEAEVTVKFDADMFSYQDVCNLMMRVGEQVGVGEGRADSPSGGLGWGFFEVVND